MIYKTEDEVALMGESALLVSRTLASLATMIKSGITTLELDAHANIFIRDHGAIPSFYKYGGFPHHICISVNDAVVHGFPNNMPLKEGDLVSVDVRSEEHTSELQSLMRISYAVFCLKKKTKKNTK